MGEIQQGRYDRLLRRTTAQVGPGSKVGNALEDLFPTLDVENAPIELLRASGWTFGMGRTSRTAAAGTTSASQIFNPPGSGQLMVVTTAIISIVVTATVGFGPGFVALTGSSVPGAERDTRDGAIQSTVGLMQFQDDGVPSAFGLLLLQANTPYTLTDQNGLAVLAPGSGFLVTLSALAETLRVSYFWRERVAEPEELNF